MANLPVFLPRISHGQRNLVDYSSWGLKESDMTDHSMQRQIVTLEDDLTKLSILLPI